MIKYWGFNLNTFEEFLPLLKKKWSTVPSTTQERISSKSLLEMSENEFVDVWSKLFLNNCTGSGYSVRGWYHDLYSPLAAEGLQWLEVGSGLGFDGVFFAEMGAQLTFFDIIEDNLKVIERICKIKGLKNCMFKQLNDLRDVEFDHAFDVVLAIGSLINAPSEIMNEERSRLGNYLKQGGRWIELCYPKSRWVKEGCMPFNDWGAKTDGEGTPWVEWYDRDKLLESLYPHRFNVVLDYEFHNSDFVFYDLKKL